MGELSAATPRARRRHHLPRRHLRAVFVLGALLLFTVLWAWIAEYRSEWRRWQARFGALTGAPAGQGGSDETGVALRQIWLADLGRVDRCTSCHLGIDDTAWAAERQPFRTHPGHWLESHRVDRFGCTLCHGGQGTATTYREAAHAPLANWSEPMRGAELMEGNCGVCHRERSPRATLWLARGRRVIADSNCVGCHDVPGYRNEEVRAPRLLGIGLKVDGAWLRGWLGDPKSYSARARMPNFRLTPVEADGLSALLMHEQSVAPAGAERVDWARADAERGGALFRRSRCVTCHSVDGRGGTVGPELSRVAGKIARDALFSFIRDPHRHQPVTLMPQFGFSDEEVRDIVAFAEREWSDPTVNKAVTVSADAAAIAAGRETYVARGCYRCHELSEVKVTAKIGPKLAGVGDRVLDWRPLVAQGIAASQPNWLFTKLRAPETLASPARMPTFGLADEDAASAMVALLSLRSQEPPPARLTTDAPVAPFAPQGEFGALVRRYRCLSCHAVGGFGGTLSTVSFDRIGSQLQRSHIEAFVPRPFAVRVSLAERMPRLGVTAAEAKLIADHLGRVFVDDAFSGPRATDAALIERGGQLFETRGCRACHIVGQRGGYVGPDLSGIGRRLTPGWIAAWLQAPQRWKPGTLEPDQGFTPDESQALAAYLMTLRESRVEAGP